MTSHQDKIRTIESVIKTLSHLAETGGHSLDGPISILRAIAEDYQRSGDPALRRLADALAENVLSEPDQDVLRDAAETYGDTDELAADMLRRFEEVAEKSPTFDQVFDVIEQKVGLDGDVHGPVITGISEAAEAVMRLYEGGQK